MGPSSSRDFTMSRSIDIATADRMQTKTRLMYRFAAAPLPPPWASATPNSSVLIHTASRIPMNEVASRKIASFLSTLPSSPCLREPINALPNLWVMLLPTAITPGTPRFIMPGVIKNAPPLPMKPLSTPPMKPRRTTCSAVPRSRAMKSLKRNSGITQSLHMEQTQHSRRERAVDYGKDRHRQQQHNRGRNLRAGCRR